MLVNSIQCNPWVRFLGRFLIYTYCTGVILPLYLYYICVCIYMCAHNAVSVLIFFVCYNLIIGFTSYWESCSLSILWMGYSTNSLLLNLHLYLYVCKYYIYVYCNMFLDFIQYNHWLYSILGKLVVCIS